MGYQLAEADRDKTDPKHLCTKCNGVLKEPVQTTCGHRYCRECINSILRYHLFTYTLSMLYRYLKGVSKPNKPEIHNS